MGKFDTLFWLNTKLFDVASVAIRLKRLPFYISNRDKLNDNALIKGERTNDICFILGLGPSLRNVDFAKIDGDVITVNSFYRIQQNIIKPKVYCIMDDIDYLSPNSTTIREATQMYPDAFFVLNGKYQKEAEQRIIGKVKKIYLFAWGKYFRPNNTIDVCRIMPIMGNIVCYAEYIAMFMGYKKIILLGCDFNSFTSKKDLHCYGEDSCKEISLAYELFCYSFCADTHYNLYQYAKKNNIQIENATFGSLIDAYPSNEQQIKYYLKNQRRK